MKEPQIVTHINSLEEISDEEKQTLIETITKTFYYNPDDYYHFANIISRINIGDADTFFSSLQTYVDVRCSLEEQLKSLSNKNLLAKEAFRKIEATCSDLKTKYHELQKVQEIVRGMMDRLSDDDAKELLRLREEAGSVLKDVEKKVASIKKEEEQEKAEALENGGIGTRIKIIFKGKKAKRKISRLEDSVTPYERKYSMRCNDVVHLFHEVVSEMPKDQADLLIKYKDLGGFENFFAIKYDFNWFLHNGEIGRLNDWLNSLHDEEIATRDVLAEEMELATPIKEKIEAREEVISHFMSHLDLFNIDSEKRKIFEDYTRRYPYLASLTLDDLSDLPDQKDAVALLPYIKEPRGKVKTLKRFEDTSR